MKRPANVQNTDNYLTNERSKKLYKKKNFEVYNSHFKIFISKIAKKRAKIFKSKK